MSRLFHGLNEASRARSDEEFVSKLGGALQEADESQLWLELLREECAIEPKLTQPLEQESGRSPLVVRPSTFDFDRLLSALMSVLCPHSSVLCPPVSGIRFLLSAFSISALSRRP